MTNTETLFEHRETKLNFQAYPINAAPKDCDLPIDWGSQRDATHVVRVSHNPIATSCYRFAKVKKTVAYIGVDETDGGIDWERWPIRTIS